MDRAMSNLESMPGGFNALRQVHEQIQVRGARAWLSVGGSGARAPP